MAKRVGADEVEGLIARRFRVGVDAAEIDRVVAVFEIGDRVAGRAVRNLIRVGEDEFVLSAHGQSLFLPSEEFEQFYQYEDTGVQLVHGDGTLPGDAELVAPKRGLFSKKTDELGGLLPSILLGIAILFLLPQVTPVRVDTFNYASVTVGATLLFAGGWWVLSARKWFKGPKVQGTPEELAAIERELGEVG